VSDTHEVKTGFERWVLPLLLTVQALGGLLALGKDILWPFTNINEAAKYTMVQGYDQIPVGGKTDYIMSPLSAYTHRPVYMEQSGSEQMYMEWNDRRRQPDSIYTPLFHWADSLAATGTPRSVVILSRPYRDISGAIRTQGDNGPFSTFSLVKEINKDCIIGDEKYYFYEVMQKRK
jgi:hypothetical protein